MKSSQIALLVLVAIIGSPRSSLLANEQPLEGLAEVQRFVNKYCIGCHNETDQQGDRSFAGLQPDVITGEQAELWNEILDRFNLGDMPPEDAPLQPSDDARVTMANRLTKILSNVSAASEHESSTVLRRLNRAEYDASVRELLGLQAMLKDPTADFPPDESAEHFRNIGEHLVLSEVLLTRYLAAAREYLDEAIHLSVSSRETTQQSFQPPFCRAMPNPDGLDRPGEYQHLRENPSDQHGYLWLTKMPRGVANSGWYTIRVLATAIDRNHPYKDSILNTDRTAPLQMGLVATRADAVDLATNDSSDRTLHTFELRDDAPQWYETTVWLDAGYTPRLTFPNGPAKIKYMRHKLMHQHRELFPTFIRDRIHIFDDMHPDYDKVSGPTLEQEFLAEQQRLKEAGKPYDVFGTAHRVHTDEAWVNFYSEYRGPRVRVFEIEIEGPVPARTNTGTSIAHSSDTVELPRQLFPRNPIDSAQATKLIKQFTSRAFRRPATAAQVAGYLRLYEQTVAAGQSATDGLRLAYQAVLCSPGFLYHRTRNGPLDDHELATRLAFFLWSAPPDAELLRWAQRGKLREAEILRAQTDRLLNDDRHLRMVSSFSDSWLRLDKLGTALPDRSEHPWYFNEGLEDAMRSETQHYISDMIRRDVGVSVLIDSDYTFVNASLARLYDLDGVVGRELRRVTLQDRRRGGLLGQAAVLTATANGIDTSPVLRGVWVLECLLGTPPPAPPPDVEPIEPDTRGTTTIREQLAAHRDVATCANCHRRIDPPGFALESFDEIGRYRQFYELDGAWRRKGPDVDPSGQLPSGESFDDIVQLKSHLMQRLDLVTRNVATKLLVQATGRLDDPADRADVLALLEQVDGDSGEVEATRAPSYDAPSGIGLRTLIHAVVQSQAFAR